MMRLNRVRWLMRWGSAPVKPSKRTGPSWALLHWFEKRGILRFVWRPGAEGVWLDHAKVTDKGRTDLSRAISEHEAHGSFRPKEAR